MTMRDDRLRLLGLLAALSLALAGCGGDDAGDAGDYPSRNVRIMAPADPGGGWDQTARTMQQVLTTGGVIDRNVEVYNVGGAGGTIGLAQFVNQETGDPHELMVMGLVMIGAIETNQSPVDLSQVTPIASLTAEAEAIVVAANSEYETLDQLLEDFGSDPRSISWGGGSAGGTDHILVGMIAQEAGVDPGDVNYIAHAGGGEAIAAILSGDVTAGVSGVGEFIDQVDAGEMRFLAVSTEEAIEGIDAPTITDSGLDVVLENWRGVMAPPDLSDEDQGAVVALVEEMHDSDAWQAALEQNGWTDFFQTGEDYAGFIEQEETRIQAVLRDLGLTEG
jgi:putative tricarboxylic transport membrane protein